MKCSVADCTEIADPRRAEELLNWKAKRSLNEIVSTAWRWRRNNAKEDDIRS